MNCAIRLNCQSSISIIEVTAALGAKPNLHLNLAPFLMKTVNFFFVAFPYQDWGFIEKEFC